MRKCVYIYIYAYIHTCIHACIHTCMHAYIHTYRKESKCAYSRIPYQDLFFCWDLTRG